MPLYYFKCQKCSTTARHILSPKEVKDPRSCAECDSPMSRDPHPPSSRVTEVLDNGAMTKRLERLADAERLFAERNEATEKSRRG